MTDFEIIFYLFCLLMIGVLFGAGITWLCTFKGLSSKEAAGGAAERMKEAWDREKGP